MPGQHLDSVTINFPDLSSADATVMARELAQMLVDEGFDESDMRVARSNDEAMDLGATLVLAGTALAPFAKSFGEAAAKALGDATGRAVARRLATLVSKAIDRLCQRRRIAVEAQVHKGGTFSYGAEYAGNTLAPLRADMPNIGTLGVVILGASRFPHAEGLDNPAFARSAATAKSLFGQPTKIFPRTSLLDLFNEPKSPAEIVEAIEHHIDSVSDMRDLLLYYCGHGGFMRDRTYFLMLNGTRAGREANTGLKLRDFRHDLEGKLLSRRLYLVIDCCYSGEAVKEFMGPDIARAVESQVTAALPSRGWTMLAASAADQVAIAPAGQELTMFTGALAQVLGGPTNRLFSFSEIAEETSRHIRLTYGLGAVMPQCHTPRQDDGNLGFARLFGAWIDVGGTDDTSAGRAEAPVLRAEVPAANSAASIEVGVASSAERPSAMAIKAVGSNGKPRELDENSVQDPRPNRLMGARIVPQISHSGYIASVAFSPDGANLEFVSKPHAACMVGGLVKSQTDGIYGRIQPS